MINKAPALPSAAIFEDSVHLSYFASQGFIVDNAIFAGDSQLTIVARSIISSEQARGVSQDLRLLVPT